MNYYISDMHFFHKRILQFDNRPFAEVEEMNEYIVSRWNEIVTNGDTVYILGDVSILRNSEELIKLVATLKGKKVLIRGNHDDLSDYRYKHLFSEIIDYKELTDHIGNQTYKLVLSYYPILMWNNQHSGAVLLYGHTHNSTEDSFFQRCVRQRNESDELNLHDQGGKQMTAINVGCMQPWMSYEPRTLKELLDGYDNGTK